MLKEQDEIVAMPPGLPSLGFGGGVDELSVDCWVGYFLWGYLCTVRVVAGFAAIG